MIKLHKQKFNYSHSWKMAFAGFNLETLASMLLLALAGAGSQLEFVGFSAALLFGYYRSTGMLKRSKLKHYQVALTLCMTATILLLYKLDRLLAPGVFITALIALGASVAFRELSRKPEKPGWR